MGLDQPAVLGEALLVAHQLGHMLQAAPQVAELPAHAASCVPLCIREGPQERRQVPRARIVREEGREVGALLLERPDDHLEVLVRQLPEGLLQLLGGDPDPGQDIAHIVEDARGDLALARGASGVDQRGARLSQLSEHAIELGREAPELVRPAVVHAGTEVLRATHALGVGRELLEGAQHDAAQQDHEGEEQDQRADQHRQPPEGRGRGALA